MRELVVVSGKGGTGKTSVVASLAVLATNAVVADCDVDAADLHLILHPETLRREVFFAGREAVVRLAECTGCLECVAACRAGAIAPLFGTVAVDPLLCEGCGLCVRVCPVQAIDFPPRRCGEWFVSNTRVGTMVHARLDPGGESSGKLVTLVRREARRIAGEQHAELILVDGPPGVGCPVIASLSGASELLAIAEPTPSGLHDLERLLVLAAHFGVPASVCVNKWDISPALSEAITSLARERGARVVGRIAYDLGVTAAQVAGKTTVEAGGKAAKEIRAVWDNLRPTESGGGGA
jgi:MinD superfamily P-loop ATPase